MNRFFTPWLFLLLAFVASPVGALPLQIGNFYPAGAPVDVVIDGEVVARRLAYLDLSKVEVAPGIRDIAIVDSDSGRSLNRANSELRGNPLLAPMLLVVGAPGGGLAFKVHQALTPRLDDVYGYGEEFLVNMPPEIVVSFLHLAPADANWQTAERLTKEIACESMIYGRTVPDLRFGGGPPSHALLTASTVAGTHLRESTTCTIRVSSSAHGSFEITGLSEPKVGTVRIVLTGDGVNQPYRLLVIVDGREVARATVAAPVAAPDMVSNNYWWDRSRPSQGITLFEMPGAGVVYGTWHTFADDGQPIWYLLDGVAGSLPGHRDLQVLEGRADNGVAFRTVGVGTLVYLDCNNAEMRVVLDGGVVRSLRLQRSLSVQRCHALQ